MTREKCKLKLKEVGKFQENNPTLHSVVIFWKSPLTSDVECRTAYFEEYMDADSYYTEQSNFYEENDIPYTSYLNTHIYSTKGELF